MCYSKSKDLPELLLKDMLKAGLYLNHVELARMIAEKSREAAEWTESLGVKYKDRVTHHRRFRVRCDGGSENGETLHQ